jgi:AFG3 family protein
MIPLCSCSCLQVRKLGNMAYERTVALLTEKRAELEAVAQLLLERENITHDDIVMLIGKRPFSSDAYDQYITASAEWAQKGREQTARDTQRRRDAQRDAATPLPPPNPTPASVETKHL